jgi:hypothetical protein
VGSEYEPLYDHNAVTTGADPAKIQAIAYADDELLRDPAIREVIEGGGLDDAPLDELELEKYMKDLTPS